MNEVDLIVTKEEEQRLDKFLVSRFHEKSRTYFQYLIENDCVKVNGKNVKKGSCLKDGDEVEIFFLATPEISLEPENIPLNILYEDDHIIIVNKPADMVVHPAVGNWSKTFVNALLYHCQNMHFTKDDVRPGIVHRLDKDTTGVLIAAKTYEAHQKLIEAFAQRKVLKKYLAICVGNVRPQTISAPIGRHPVKRKEMTVREDGKIAISKVELLASNGKFSLVSVELITGRTHQIRVHLSHLKTPILGDPVYGSSSMNNSFEVSKQFLHAYRMELNHPITNLPIKITAPLSEDFKKQLEKLLIEIPPIC